MDELNRPLPGSETATQEPTEPARSDAFAGDSRTQEVIERTANDENPLFSGVDDIDPELAAMEESKDDLAVRGAALAGAAGGTLPGATVGLAGHGAALGVNTEAGEPVEVSDEEEAGRAPGD